jgi:hypothetical protein
MFFGSYLVKEKVISMEDFVECLTIQLKSAPTLIEALFENDSLSSEKILELVDLQFIEKKSLTEIIINSSILTREELQDVITKSCLRQQSFSDILLNKEKVELLDLKMHFEKYEKTLISTNTVTEDKETGAEISSAALESLKELDGVDLSEFGEAINSKEEEEEEAVLSQEAEPEMSEAALESLRELNAEAADELSGEGADESSGEIKLSDAALESLRELDPNAADGLVPTEGETCVAESNESSPNETFKKEFCETFNESMYNKMNKIIKIIFNTVKEEGDFSNFFNSLFREFHLIKGASRLAGFKLIEEVVEDWEDILDNFFKLEEEEKKEWFNSHGSKLSTLVDSIWDIRNQIKLNDDETSISFEQVNKILNDFSSSKIAS